MCLVRQSGGLHHPCCLCASLRTAPGGLAQRYSDKLPTHPLRSSLHHRDFSSALDHLHRFFDYTQAEGGLAGAPPAGAGGAAQDEVAARSQLQSAALSLGAMHAQLGHVEEAMQALNETVRWQGGIAVDGLLCWGHRPEEVPSSWDGWMSY